MPSYLQTHAHTHSYIHPTTHAHAHIYMHTHALFYTHARARITTHTHTHEWYVMKDEQGNCFTEAFFNITWLCPNLWWTDPGRDNYVRLHHSTNFEKPWARQKRASSRAVLVSDLPVVSCLQRVPHACDRKKLSLISIETGLVSLFNGISTFLGYLMPNSSKSKKSICTIYPLAEVKG